MVLVTSNIFNILCDKESEHKLIHISKENDYYHQSNIRDGQKNTCCRAPATIDKLEIIECFTSDCYVLT